MGIIMPNCGANLLNLINPTKKLDKKKTATLENSTVPMEFIIHYPLPTTHYLLPITCYPLPFTCYPLPATHYLLPTTYYLLPITHYPLPVIGVLRFNFNVLQKKEQPSQLLSSRGRLPTLPLSQYHRRGKV